jgi:hypothetical protein
VLEYWKRNRTKPLDIVLDASIDTLTKAIKVNMKLNYLIASSSQNLVSVWLLEDGIVG